MTRYLLCFFRGNAAPVLLSFLFLARKLFPVLSLVDADGIARDGDDYPYYCHNLFLLSFGGLYVLGC